ncbi:MAG: hypothetical protein EP330_20035 [Deltaproteobacteria bacterium]|nr:MAG: hypothetical protein EP330_20035 [Deltaproteobacteria bacterium]
MIRVLASLFVLCFALSAHAGDGYTRANGVAIAGGVATALAGPALGAGSMMIMPGPEHTDGLRFEVGLGLYASGFALATGGGAAFAMGSLASRGALVNRGARVSAVPGALATGIWATGVTFAYVVPVISDFHAPGWVAIGSYASVLVLGTTQLALNHAASRRLSGGARSVKGVSVGLAPSVHPRGGGLALAGQW